MGPPSFTRSPAGSPLFNLPLLWGLKGKVEPSLFFYRSAERSSGIGGCLYHFVFSFSCFCFSLCCLAHLSQTPARWCPKRVPLWFIPQGCVSAGLLRTLRPREWRQLQGVVH